MLIPAAPFSLCQAGLLEVRPQSLARRISRIEDHLRRRGRVARVLRRNRPEE